MFPGLRPLGFYDALVRLGNVALVSGAIDGHDLIARSRGVVTIAGTAGFEALFFGRPVMMFGRSFYEDFTEGVFRAGSFEDIVKRLDWMLDCSDLDSSRVDRFLAAVLRRSYSGVNELPAPGVNDTDNHTALARGLIAELDFRLKATV